MLYFNSCPKCRTGAIESITEWDGAYFLCLNCGFTLEVRQPHPAPDNGSGISLPEGEEVAA